jgi:small conductance mechanosensitive channel
VQAPLEGLGLLTGESGHSAGALAARTFAWNKLIDAAGDLAMNLAVAALIVLATVWLARWAARITRAALARVHPHRGAPDVTLQSFGASMARNLVLVVGLVAMLQQLGVRTTSIIAVLGAASLAIGLALQGALSNVAAGVMILLFRPYRVGDLIESAGRMGRVESLDLFVTELSTLDNLKIVIPNSKVFGDVIVNHTVHERRRADAVFRVRLATDVPAMLERLRRRLDADPRVLKTPPPLIEVTGMAEAWVEIAVRSWVAQGDLGRVKADTLLWARILEADPAAELPPPSTTPAAPPPEAQTPPEAHSPPERRAAHR